MTPPLTCPECGTFVRLDWTDRCESCQAPLLEPVAQSRPSAPTHKGGNLIVVIASVIVLFVIGGGIAFAVSDGDPLAPNSAPLAQTSATTTATGDVSTTTQPMSGSALAQAVEPSSGDVGSAWSQTDERVNSASERTVKSACWPSDAQMSSNVAGSEGDFTYNVASSKGNNLLTFDVTVASNADVAAHQQAQVASKSYEQCLATADNSLASSLGTVKSNRHTRQPHFARVVRRIQRQHENVS